MKGLKLFAERIFGSVVLFFCAILGIKVEPVDEQLAEVKQLVRKRPRYMPSRFGVMIECSQEAVVFLKKGFLLLVAFALMYLMFCIFFSM